MKIMATDESIMLSMEKTGGDSGQTGERPSKQFFAVA